MKTLPHILLLCCLLSAFSPLRATDPVKTDMNNTPETHYYPSTRSEGWIGKSLGNPLDSPIDNIFQVEIDASLSDNDIVWLTYELYGITHTSGVSKSINEQYSVGGTFVQFNDSWTPQQEQVKADWLLTGKNIIRFTLPEGVKYHYKIRNLGVKVQRSAQKHERSLVINAQNKGQYFEDKAYLHGFVYGKDSEDVCLYVDNTEVDSYNAAFEHIVVKNTKDDAWTTTVKAIFPDGETIEKTVNFGCNEKADQVNILDQPIITPTQKEMLSGTGLVRYAIQGASVTIDQKDSDIVDTPTEIIPLRSIDIPALNSGMVNVSRYHGGYRLSPQHASYDKAAIVSIAYDPDKIPKGYKPEDVRTYYFDTQHNRWKALRRDSIDMTNHRIISKTMNNQDMINGILKVPESPESNAYTPTSIKDIKAADPSAAINMMQPPSASNMGDANMGYPINIPPGRQGMQPQLAIQYNSGGGNGWLGLGWNLQVPSISIDTRWGVPRYDLQKETETYLINGEQLSPVAHKGELVNRTTDKRFYRRVEGAFDKIIRHGNSPANYHWEVTDKMGTRYFYGGESTVDNNAVLKDAQGNIAYWALVKILDLNGNFVTYNHSIQQDVGVAGGTVMGQQLYCEEILYTGSSGQDGKYKIVFTRDRELGESLRVDKSIDARYGFKKVTADLLRKIEVQFNNQNIRSYELQYANGAFFKTLLQTIIEFDASGAEFTRHQMEYYDDVRTGENNYMPFQSNIDWTVPSDGGLDTGFILQDNSFSDEPTLLSGNAAEDVNIGVVVAVGFDPNVTSKSNSVGGSYNYSDSDSEGNVSLIDINGDGLQDKVFRNGNGLFYSPNQGLSTTGAGEFEDADYPILGLSDFYMGESKSNTYGVEANFVAFAGYSETDTESTTTTYFTDANGDQLIDIVRNGTVYFNTYNPGTGVITFTPDSGQTVSPVFVGEAVSEDVIDRAAQEAEQQEAIDQNPLHDVIRMWRAPYSGTVSISGALQRIVDLGDEDRQEEPVDSIRVAVQLRDTELWSRFIDADDTTPYTPAGVTSLSVQKGDNLYFRVGSVDNGSYDQINWSPEITYIDEQLKDIDANGLAINRFTALEDFLLTSPQQITPPLNGTVALTGNFIKPQTTDDVQLVVLRTTETISQTGNNTRTTDTLLQRSYTWNEQVNTTIDTTFSVVNTGAVIENYESKVLTSTNIDWAALEWKPRLEYITTDSGINLQQSPIVIDVVPNYSLYAFTEKITEPFALTVADTTFIDTVTVRVAPRLTFTGINPFGSERDTLTLSIKKRDTLLAKKQLIYRQGSLITPDSILSFPAVANRDTLYIEYHTRDRELAGTFGEKNVSFTTDYPLYQGRVVSAGIYTGLPDNGDNEDFIFGHLYRGWGQFAWNGNREKAMLPINENELKLSEAALNQGEINTNGLSGEDLNNQDTYDPTQDQFVLMVANGQDRNWTGYDAFTYLDAQVISSSRYGVDDLDILEINTGDGTGLSAIDRISQVETTSFTLGGGVGGVGGSASVSNSKTIVTTDYMDMNGDRYPDIVTNRAIQYTAARGGLSTQILLDPGNVSESNGTTNSVALSGSVAIPSSKSNSSPKGSQKGSTDAGDARSTNGSINVGITKGDNDTDTSYMDINGDGLPDRVNVANKTVQLNLGYSFADPEPWNFDEINIGNSDTETGGFGFSIFSGSIAGGYSLARSDNEVLQTFQDVNGDGLMDIVIKGNPVQVKINLGNSFAEATNWQGIGNFSENETASESLNAAFTFGFYIPLINIKFVVNPSGATNESMARETAKITDIDGDGFPDYLTSESDGQLSVKRSTIARTNKLKAVQRPLGASFALDYTPIGNTFDQPNTVWVLSSVSMFDGVEEQDGGANTMLSTFEYDGGFYDRNERDFYGFKTVKTRQLDTENGDAVYRTVVQEFINDNFYEKGLLANEILQDANDNRFTESLNVYSLKNVQTGAGLPDSVKEDATAAAFPAMTEMVNNFYEGQAAAGETTRMTYQYNPVGNVTGYTDEGDSGSDDEISSQIQYHPETGGNYLVGIPSKITVTGNGKTLRERESTIDNAGNITQLRKKLADGTTALFDMQYNNVGNITRMTRPANQLGERLFFDYQYDPEVQTYVEKVDDAYGYSSTSQYDYRFGQLLNTTDINGNRMEYTLDDAGRVTKIRGPLEIAAGVDFTLKFSYNPQADIPWALTQHYDPQFPGNELETVTFIDGLARVLQVQKDGAIYQGVNNADQEMRIVSGRLSFDAFGRTITSRYPTTITGAAGTFAANPDTVQPTETEYDVLDRATRVTLPDGAVTQTQYNFGSDRNSNQQFSTLVTDANGIQKESFTNVRGLTTSVREQYSQGGDIWTSYSYNAINELIEVTDDQDNRITSAYDNFGRRTSVDHPDAGLTSFTYDLASNLTSKVTANLKAAGQAIIYTYDRERLTNITYPQNPSNNVKYTYGNTGDPDNRAGRIVTQEDGAGKQEFSYNPLGAMVKNKRDIIVAGENLASFTTRWQYDTWNRVTEITYPDDEKVTYTYNLGGLVQSLSGVSRLGSYEYVKQLGYDKFEQRVYMGYGNGTESFYSYEPERRRLKNLITESATNRRLMDNEYTYDKVNNILRLVNTMEVSTSDELLGGPSDYNYQYDDLYRLTNATGSYTDEEDNHRFTLDMEYNSIHSITKKTQVTESKDQADGDNAWIEEPEVTYDWEYQYEDAQPHAPIQMGKFTYLYDLNGNLVSRPERTFNADVNTERENLIWDEENRLTAVTEAADDGIVLYNIYDAGGERVLKTNNDNNVEITINGTVATPRPVDKLDDYITYVNPYYVLRKDYFTTHFYIEGERVATKLSEEDKDLGLYWHHQDHLGSSAYTTGVSSGETTQHIEYFPFGETFIDEKEDGRDEDAGKDNPYRYNSKELDQETGLYYYGARYYDPRTSVWQSVDPPIIGKFLIGQHNGGVYNSKNLSIYSYTYNNPIKYLDPDGNQVDVVDTVLDFVPFVGSAKDIYKGARDGDWLTLGIGVGGLIVDVATLGAGSIVKGAVKTGVKQGIKQAAKQTVKEAAITRAKKAAILQTNKLVGQAAEKKVTNALIKRFKSSDVGTQITARFKDGKAVVFDNVVVKNGRIQLINETKTGAAKLSTAQQRFFEGGEAVEFVGEKAKQLNILGSKVDKSKIATEVTRIE